jgi:hypothetical protein
VSEPTGEVSDAAKAKDPMEDLIDEALKTFCFSVPHEKFLYKIDGRWQLDSPIGEKGIISHLVSKRINTKLAKGLIKNGAFKTVHGIDIIPGEGEFVEQGGAQYLNVWARPSLVPEAGEYPRIRRILSWLTNKDETAEDWLRNWVAAKVQNPALLPRTAVVLAGQPRSGKGTFALLMQSMLGPENCATISRRTLDTNFNARWINKLFVLADEITEGDKKRSLFEDLKTYIASDDTEIEAKFANRLKQRNRLAWVIATNDKVSPVIVEKGDRRYTVLTNHTTLTAEYTAMILGCFEPSNGKPTESFAAEMRAFYHDCLTRSVDASKVSMPHENGARDALINAGASSIDLFVAEVKAGRFDFWFEQTKFRDTHDLEKQDFGARGISRIAVYRTYRLFCERTGTMANRFSGFGAAVANYDPPWTEVAVDGVDCYIVPRL